MYEHVDPRKWQVESSIKMLSEFVNTRTFLVATPMGSWTAQGRKPWDTVVWWAYKAGFEVEEFPTEVAESFWICSLIDEGQEFDVWIVDLEPEKRISPENSSTVQDDENSDNKKPITVRYAKDMPVINYQVITKYGAIPISEINPRGAIMKWARNTYIKAGQKKILDVAPGYWFFVLIDKDDTPFDCWVRQL